MIFTTSTDDDRQTPSRSHQQKSLAGFLLVQERQLILLQVAYCPKQSYTLSLIHTSGAHPMPPLRLPIHNLRSKATPSTLPTNDRNLSTVILTPTSNPTTRGCYSHTRLETLQSETSMPHATRASTDTVSYPQTIPHQLGILLAMITFFVLVCTTPIAPQPRPFSPLDMHPASTQTQHLAPLPFTTQLAFKPTRPDSPPPASCQPQDAIRTDATSPEPLEAHDLTERNTKQPRLGTAKAAQIRHDLPEDWDSRSRRAKKHWLQSHK